MKPTSQDWRDTNSSTSYTRGSTVVVTSWEIELYDRLPSRKWRVLVDSLPNEQSLESIHEYIRQLGDARAYEAVCRAFETNPEFAGWHRPKPDYDPVIVPKRAVDRRRMRMVPCTSSQAR